MIQRFAPLVLLLSLVVAACGADDATGAFDADPGPIDADLRAALGDDVDPEMVPAVQRNFLDHCVKGGGVDLPELEPVQRDGLIAVCGCAYDAVVAFSFETVERGTGDSFDPDDVDIRAAAFEVFVAIDDDLKTTGTELDSDVQELVRTCILSESGL